MPPRPFNDGLLAAYNYSFPDFIGPMLPHHSPWALDFYLSPDRNEAALQRRVVSTGLGGQVITNWRGHASELREALALHRVIERNERRIRLHGTSYIQYATHRGVAHGGVTLLDLPFGVYTTLRIELSAVLVH
ncbi:hypothetical protein KBC55_01715 [Patescibacteria group bacterium]|nr:hypothetical protein [Patescibacteria group bacterium]